MPASLNDTSTVSVSLLELFFQADWVVQAVIILLLFMSIWSWTIIFAKASLMRALKAESEEFEEQFWTAADQNALGSLLVSDETDLPLQDLFTTAQGELKAGDRSSNGSGNWVQRVERMLVACIARHQENFSKHMVYLASIGATAPFIGLFGTVWGIMNSFQGIAATQSTNLAVVAPGIAEALFATALGLIAAIPAVLGYNKISADIKVMDQRMESFAEEVIAVLSRNSPHDEKTVGTSS